MQSFMITLIICSVTMSILAILYIATTPLLAKRYSEKGRYYAWLIIIFGLIIPFRPQWDNAIVNVEVPTQTHTIMTAEQLGVGALPSTANQIIFVPTLDAVTPNVSLSISWWQISFAVWLTGMILFVFYQGIRHYRFMKMVRRWSENITDVQVLSVFERLKSEMNITKRICIYVCPLVGSPMLIGIFNPRILLPTAKLAKDELQFILKHELVHYKRKDLLYKFLVLLATAIHWFNPIVYLSVKAINILCETSCDTEVVNGMDADNRQMYSEAIVGVVKYQSKLKTALSTNFYGGKKGMENRISSIMDTKKKKVGAVILCSLLTLTMGTGFVFASSSNGATDNITPPNVPRSYVMTPNVMLPEVEAIPNTTIIENLPSHNVSHTSIRTIDDWIAFQLAMDYEFAENTLVESRIWAVEQVAQDRIWAVEQVVQDRIHAESSPNGRVWNAGRYENADEWLISRYQWAEEWAAGRYQWADEWIASRYEWAEEWINSRHEWVTKIRDLYDNGLVTVIRYEDGNIARLDINTVNEIAQESVAVNTAVAEASGIVDTNQNRRSSVVIFDEYEEWGLTIEGLYSHLDGGFIATAIQNVFFQGQLIRGFSDFGHGVDMSISSFDQGEDMWIHVIRDVNGNIERLDKE